jgi:iron complex transport system substrate-binding protein
MPIRVHADVRHLDQDEFGEIAYEVMDHVFAIHNKMGRFLDEAVYRNAVAARVGGDSQTEVLIEVAFEDFLKEYYMDLLVAGGAVFELKTVRKLVAAHRSQLLNYLLLCGLSHGKPINSRPEKVEHEFVNTHLTHSDRTAFDVADHEWREPGSGDRSLREWLLAFLREMGAGLDVHLYESAASHFFGGEDTVLHEVDVLLDGQCLGRQKVRLAAPNWAFKVTTIDNADLSHFEDHARRFLQHTSLDGFHWINITRALVTFQSITKA